MATSPTSGPGGGGSFNGGTITNPLILDGSAQPAGTEMLVVTAPHLASGAFLQLDAEGFGGVPGLDLTGDGAGSVGDFNLASESTGAVDAPSLTLGRSGSGNFVALNAPTVRMKTAVVLFKRITAPADADLDTSSFALWLDPTPGAAKLMVKAKDSAGTVVAASIALA